MQQAGADAAAGFTQVLRDSRNAPPAMNLLWSFFYLRMTRKMTLSDFLGGLAAPRIRFFADSGAHTARTMGKSIDIDDYGKWLVDVQELCTIYANLDVIGAPDATRRNQEYLETQYGLHPMPVFHTGEPFSVLEDYIADGYTYIALGKLLGNSQKDLTPWIARCFEVAGDRAVFHGFGLTVWQQLKRWPWYSTDSSSWVASVRYGELKLFDNGRWVQISLRDRDKIRANIKLLRSYGLGARDLSGEFYERAKIAGASAVAHYRAADWLAERNGPMVLPPGKGYPPPDTPAADKIVRVYPGPEPNKTYLANTASTNHRWHANSFSLYLADSSSKWTPAGAEAIAKEIER